MTDAPRPDPRPARSAPPDCQSSESAADGTAAKSHDGQSSGEEPGVESLVLDARGLRCPLPVIRLAALLRDLPPGTEVVLLATDPAARSDVAAFCRMRGHELVRVEDRVEDRRAGDEPSAPAHTAYTVRRSG